MTERTSSGSGTRHRTRIGRRRFLGGLGAGGLAVAGTVFGQTTYAQASSCGCCNLAHCPPNGNYQSCIQTSGDYAWLCFYTSGGIHWQCRCCETKNDVQSSYACWPQ